MHLYKGFLYLQEFCQKGLQQSWINHHQGLTSLAQITGTHLLLLSVHLKHAFICSMRFSVRDISDLKALLEAYVFLRCYCIWQSGLHNFGSDLVEIHSGPYMLDQQRILIRKPLSSQSWSKIDINPLHLDRYRW